MCFLSLSLNLRFADIPRLADWQTLRIPPPPCPHSLHWSFRSAPLCPAFIWVLGNPHPHTCMIRSTLPTETSAQPPEGLFNWRFWKLCWKQTGSPEQPQTPGWTQHPATAMTSSFIFLKLFCSHLTHGDRKPLLKSTSPLADGQKVPSEASAV